MATQPAESASQRRWREALEEKVAAGQWVQARCGQCQQTFYAPAGRDPLNNHRLHCEVQLWPAV